MKPFIRSLFAITLLLFITTAEIAAVPVYPLPKKLTQPDGTSITIIGHGDEFFSYMTTTDGYTVVKCDDNAFRYATMQGEDAVATDIIAHDVDARSADEKAFIAANAESLRFDNNVFANARRNARAQLDTPDTPVTPETPLSNPNFNLKKFRGLLILVNYNDCELRLGDEKSNEEYTRMMNELNYNGFDDPKMGFQRYTGSVRDYFNDNTFGQFAPEFDVVGPVNIDYSMYDAARTSNTRTLATAALKAADPYVDYSKYDADGDGKVDMFYIIYAGNSSNYTGNDTKLLWPHATSLGTSLKLDGMTFTRYACSTELYGWVSEKDSTINGIGTIIHEFSHVLGYEDHYDTSSGGHENPGKWDVMAGGNYNNMGRTPIGYNAYELYAGGFVTPKVINDSIGTTFALSDLRKTGECYRINNTQKKVYFLLENRQKTKWDAYNPGTGMLVWRVDSTSSTAWSYNRVNAQDHSYFKLLRANGTSGGNDSAYDPFPGKALKRVITNTTNPNLKSYSGYKTEVYVNNILEKSGIVSFTINKDGEDDSKPEGALFYEGFSDCYGGGGNDNDFSSSMATTDFYADNDGWTYNIARGCDKCARFGNNTKVGTATTPEFTLEDGKNYTLTFLAAPFATDKNIMTVSVASGNATLVNDSIDGSAPATSVEITTVKGQFTEYSMTMKGSGAQKLTFKGGTKAYRFLLDEVLIVEKKAPDYILGDANNDGIISVADLAMVASFILDPETTTGINLEASDVNEDGDITVADLAQLAAMILGE